MDISSPVDLGSGLTGNANAHQGLRFLSAGVVDSTVPTVPIKANMHPTLKKCQVGNRSLSAVP